MNKSYHIEMATNLFDLEAQVQKSIHNGYIPQGGPFVWIPYICQAMVLKEESQQQHIISELDKEHPIEDFFNDTDH